MKNKAIIISLVAIALIMLCIWWFAYRPIFSGGYSSVNADWGGFGDFFWGLGTMLLTGLNVYVFHNLTVVFENAKQERDEAFFQFELLKLRLHKQQELIDNFCQAEHLMFSMIDDENGICLFDEKRVDTARELYAGLNGYEDILNTISSEEYQKTYRRFHVLYNAFRSQDEENPYAEYWEENLYALHRSLDKIEKSLKREYISTLSRTLHNRNDNYK